MTMMVAPASTVQPSDITITISTPQQYLEQVSPVSHYSIVAVVSTSGGPEGIRFWFSLTARRPEVRINVSLLYIHSFVFIGVNID